MPSPIVKNALDIALARINKETGLIHAMDRDAVCALFRILTDNEVLLDYDDIYAYLKAHKLRDDDAHEIANVGAGIWESRDPYQFWKKEFMDDLLKME